MTSHLFEYDGIHYHCFDVIREKQFIITFHEILCELPYDLDVFAKFNSNIDYDSEENFRRTSESFIIHTSTPSG